MCGWVCGLLGGVEQNNVTHTSNVQIQHHTSTSPRHLTLNIHTQPSLTHFIPTNLVRYVIVEVPLFSRSNFASLTAFIVSVAAVSTTAAPVNETDHGTRGRWSTQAAIPIINSFFAHPYQVSLRKSRVARVAI